MYCGHDVRDNRLVFASQVLVEQINELRARHRFGHIITLRFVAAVEFAILVDFPGRSVRVFCKSIAT
jgi:hypothetical protein